MFAFCDDVVRSRWRSCFIHWNIVQHNLWLFFYLSYFSKKFFRLFRTFSGLLYQFFIGDRSKDIYTRVFTSLFNLQRNPHLSCSYFNSIDILLGDTVLSLLFISLFCIHILLDCCLFYLFTNS